MNGKRFLFSCGTLLALAVLGAIAGGGLMFAHLRGYLTPWQNLGQPPTPMVAFVPEQTTLDEVAVKTQRDEIYTCQASAQADCWQAQTELNAEAPEDVCVTRPNFIEPQPPGAVQSELTVTFCHAETAALAKYVLLADGTVWRWRHFSSSYLVLLEIVFLPLCGAGAGGMLGVLVLVLVWWRRWRPANKKP